MTTTFVPHPTVTSRLDLRPLGTLRVAPAGVYRRRRLVAALVLATTVFSATLVADELAGRATGTPGGAPVRMMLPTARHAVGRPAIAATSP